MRMLILLLAVRFIWRRLRKLTIAQVGMAMTGAAYVYGAMYIDTYYARGTFECFMWAALWMPIKWTKRMPQEMIKESWADKNAIHS